MIRNNTKAKPRSITILLLLLVLEFTNALNAQSSNESEKINFINKFKITLRDSSNINSSERTNKISKQGNSLDFLYLSYNIDARNTLFKATKDPEYLRQNFVIIENILNAGEKTKDQDIIWLAHSPDSKYSSINNKEVPLYEGYLFRYIAEYQYLIENNLNISGIEQLRIPIKYTEGVFFKWYNRSLIKFKDDSQLQNIRTHIGAHWAIVAMYLNKLSPNSKNQKIYYNFFQRYNTAIKNNFRVDSVDGITLYKWNQTYDSLFTNQQIDLNIYNKASPTIQDVSHGNHIIEFVLNSYELKMNYWSANDIQYLANTLKYKIWRKNTLSFSDNIDGTDSPNKANSNTGWKGSDGWMKLMFYDKDIYPIYMSYYLKNNNFIDKTYFNLQFYANFARFKSSINLLQ